MSELGPSFVKKDVEIMLMSGDRFTRAHGMVTYSETGVWVRHGRIGDIVLRQFYPWHVISTIKEKEQGR